MLYIMRHGKTEWNMQHRLQGRTDIPLNDVGIQMATDAREQYKAVHFDVCYCSPLIRARKTAEILLQYRNVPIIPDERLVEMGFGIYEGKANCFEEPDCPVNIIFQHPEQYTASVGGAESFEELYARTGDFLKNTVAPLLQSKKDVLIIGHGAMNSCMFSQVQNRPLKDFWSTVIENCKLIPLL